MQWRLTLSAEAAAVAGVEGELSLSTHGDVKRWGPLAALEEMKWQASEKEEQEARERTARWREEQEKGKEKKKEKAEQEKEEQMARERSAGGSGSAGSGGRRPGGGCQQAPPDSVSVPNRWTPLEN